MSTRLASEPIMLHRYAMAETVEKFSLNRTWLADISKEIYERSGQGKPVKKEQIIRIFRSALYYDDDAQKDLLLEAFEVLDIAFELMCVRMGRDDIWDFYQANMQQRRRLFLNRYIPELKQRGKPLVHPVPAISAEQLYA